MGEKRTCRAPGCTAQVAPSKGMCRRHWFQVPKPIRDSIWHWYRRYRDKSISPEEQIDAIRQLREAWDQAAATLAAKGEPA